jgi:hypothetical protein
MLRVPWRAGTVLASVLVLLSVLTVGCSGDERFDGYYLCSGR